jgi:hypothetical protein
VVYSGILLCVQLLLSECMYECVCNMCWLLACILAQACGYVSCSIHCGILLAQPTGFATLWQTEDCVLPQLIHGRLWCVVESGRTVRPWMPLGAASHGAVYMALRWFSCTRGAVGWVSQQVAPSSRWIFLWSEQPVAWSRPL